jgi:hypothetical protein
MNHTNKYTARDAERLIQQLRVGRVPSFMGSFDSLLARNMVPGIKDLGDFINGKTEGIKQGTEVGYNDGLNAGLEKGMKEFIVNGENQFFVDKTDPSRYKVYPFSNVQQIIDSPVTGPIIKDFTAQEHFKPELEKFDNFIDEYIQKMSTINDEAQNDEAPNDETIIDFKSNKVTNSPYKKHFKSKYSADTTDHRTGFVKTPDLVDFDERKDRVEKDLKIRRDYIDSRYKEYAYRSDGSQITSLEEIMKDNDIEIEVINEKLQALSNKSKQPSDTYNANSRDFERDRWQFEYLGNKYDKRMGIKDIIDDYRKDRESFTEGQLVKMKIETLKNTKSTIKNLFAQHKKGTTPMMITDDFEVYNVDQLRKLYVDPQKTKEERDKEPLLDIFSKIEQRKIIAENATGNVGTVLDYRTKDRTPITLANLQDQIFVPKQKKVVDLYPEKYLHIKYPTDPNEPMQIEGAVKISTQSKAKPKTGTIRVTKSNKHV